MNFIIATITFNSFKQKHVNHILLPLYEKVKFNDVPGDNYLTVYNRLNAVTWACKVGYKDCVDNALRLYRQWMNDPDNNESVTISSYLN